MPALTRLNLAFLLGAALAGTALAQGYPHRPVRVVVPFAAGGAVDTMARALGQKLNDAWSLPVVVDNRPGAGGNIGADAVAKSPADGYTLLITTHGFAISKSLYRKLPFDAVRDFVPVTQLISSYVILVSNPGVPANSVRELIALAKSRPGTVNYGSTGIGAPPHLLGELFKIAAGIDMVHVPYKGDAPLTQALLAGEVQVAFEPLSGVLSHIQSGRLRALGITSAARSAALPDVPTIIEAGVPFESTGWLGIFSPAKTPPEIVQEQQREMAKAIFGIRERLPAWGYEPVGSTSEQFAAKFRADLATYAKVIREAGIPLQD
jgi:tripartite-type tricarboxylate transporter receptor subunit TctC